MSIDLKPIGFFPGSFDPPTKGHFAIVQAVIPLFSRLVIGIGQNSQKTYSWSPSLRKEMLEEMFQDMPSITVMIYEGMTIDAAAEVGARYLIRGIRDEKDSAYERQIAEANKALLPNIETIFVPSPTGAAHINSSIVREIHKHGGNVRPFIHERLWRFFD
jgi:pantetheine-phosphate adenylyltransferase